MNKLRRLLYCSRNLITGTPETVDHEVTSILTSSRKNNLAVNITGALLFDGVAFTQVLEGPLGAVEAIYERIQCDTRHGDVTILENCPIEQRHFSNWSMAFADPRSSQLLPEATSTVAQAFELPNSAASGVLHLLHRLILNKRDWLLTR